MAKMHPYLNFDGNTEEAFNFYKSVLGGEFMGGIHRMGEMPEMPGMTLSESDKNKVMHVALAIDEHTVLMASDTMPGMGNSFTVGNNVQLSLHPSSREEADRLFNSLSAGGKVEMPLEDAFWGAYFGSFVDKFGIHWMINYEKNAQ